VDATELRDRLSGLGAGPGAVILDDSDRTVPPLEGALAIRATDDGFSVVTVDYGRPVPLWRGASYAAAAEFLLAYLVRPLPSPREATTAELDALVEGAEPHYGPLRDTIIAAGAGGALIELPPGIPVDRIGALDGNLLYPLGASFESRSLPPHALRAESGLHRFVTAGIVLVRAEIAAPWFGRPGGAVRFTLADAGTGIRDLVVDGKLERLDVAA
jgi:hypothetical protein